MSQYYGERMTLPILTRQRSMGKKQQTMGEILAKLAKVRPQLAAQLAAVDWDAVIGHVAKLALQATAEAQGCVFSETYATAPKNGRCIGSIKANKGSCTMGLAMNGRDISFYWRGASVKPNAQQQRWQETYERAYREEALAATLRIIGIGEVKRAEAANGDVMLVASIKEAG